MDCSEAGGELERDVVGYVFAANDLILMRLLFAKPALVKEGKGGSPLFLNISVITGK
jgi:hypothetical protein